ncbi:MAG: CPBP family intramembrane glutamic endopeptidase [Planctomycetota bacterium]
MGTSNNRLIRIASAFYVGVIVASVLYASVFGHTELLLGDQAATTKSILQGIAIGLAIVALCHAGHAIFRPVRRATMLMARMLGPITIPQALLLAALSGFAEELFFRGALWPHLGLMGTAILFGILHTVPARALMGYPIFAFLAGIALGVLREESGSLWPAVACHFTVNALNLAWLGRVERRRLGRRVLTVTREPSEKRLAAEPLPVPQEVGEDYPRTIWRYHLRVELTGTDRQTLPQCLEAEDLALFQAEPREEVYGKIHEGLFVFADEFDEPFVAFPDDIAAISTYLFQVVTGVEVAERRVSEDEVDDVRAWKITSRRGEWVKVPLLVEASVPGQFEVDPDREDIEVVAARWSEYPRWFQDGMRFKYPSLRDL